MDPGTQVGRYQIEASLGHGGMGEVYRAFDPTLRRRVALKVLAGERFSEVEMARVLREARAAAALSHPNVVAVYDAGVASDHGCYIVMELIEGSSLRQILREGTPPPTSALRWLREIAAALS